MIAFMSNGPGTEQATEEGVRKLVACDDIRTFEEAGWFCAIGFRQDPSGPGKDKVIALHFSSHEHYLEMTGQGGRTYRSGRDEEPAYGYR